jgi:hypothetical protein
MIEYKLVTTDYSILPIRYIHSTCIDSATDGTINIVRNIDREYKTSYKTHITIVKLTFDGVKILITNKKGFYKYTVKTTIDGIEMKYEINGKHRMLFQVKTILSAPRLERNILEDIVKEFTYNDELQVGDKVSITVNGKVVTVNYIYTGIDTNRQVKLAKYGQRYVYNRATKDLSQYGTVVVYNCKLEKETNNVK